MSPSEQRAIRGIRGRERGPRVEIEIRQLLDRGFSVDRIAIRLGVRQSAVLSVIEKKPCTKERVRG